MTEWVYEYSDVACIVEVTTEEPTFSDECGAGNEQLTLPETEGVTYDVVDDGAGTITVTATADEGYVLSEDSVTEWVYEYSDAACPLKKVTVVGPSFSDLCGPGNTVLTLPSVEGVSYSQSTANGVITVTATAQDGYELVGDTVFTFTINDAACVPLAPAPVVVVEPAPEVEGVQESGRATGRLATSCQGTVRVTMRNSTSSAVIYKVVVGKKVTKVKVKAESTRRYTTTGPNRSVAKLMLGSKVLAKKRVPGSCAVPEVLPATGLRS